MCRYFDIDILSQMLFGAVSLSLSTPVFSLRECVSCSRFSLVCVQNWGRCLYESAFFFTILLCVLQKRVEGSPTANAHLDQALDGFR